MNHSECVQTTTVHTVDQYYQTFILICCKRGRTLLRVCTRVFTGWARPYSSVTQQTCWCSTTYSGQWGKSTSAVAMGQRTKLPIQGSHIEDAVMCVTICKTLAKLLGHMPFKEYPPSPTPECNPHDAVSQAV